MFARKLDAYLIMSISPLLQQLKIKIFADGADINGIVAMSKDPLIKGFTTNPTLMKRAGVESYEGFARQLLSLITDRPVSLEVFDDEFSEMERQALMISSWGTNVNVKIPITNTRGESSAPLIGRLANQGVHVNVTAIMTHSQIEEVVDQMPDGQPVIISVFAGRIADTGVDPVPHMKHALQLLKSKPDAELLWASPRELLNVFQADEVGCHIITATNDVLAKLVLVGKGLDEYSLDTVKMFYNDARGAGYNI